MSEKTTLTLTIEDVSALHEAVGYWLLSIETTEADAQFNAGERTAHMERLSSRLKRAADRLGWEFDDV